MLQHIFPLVAWTILCHTVRPEKIKVEPSTLVHQKEHFSQHDKTALSLADPTVTIGDGVLIGTATVVANVPHATVHSFLGIPFAQSPPLRFAPPQAPQRWSSPLRTQNWRAACIQQFQGLEGSVLQNAEKKIFGTYGEAAPEESEDCLYMNVYAPPSASKDKLKPVMVWVHGGNLQFGTAGLERYSGGSLVANEDVLVVTFNYRLNIFGFSNANELTDHEQNAGFHDQRLALQWVHENIAAFGGDSNKVLLFGESAGGYSVKQLLANPPSPLPFAAAVMQSQQSGHSVDSKQAWSKAVRHFNCQERISPLRCMRQVSAERLKSFIETRMLSYGPVYEDSSESHDVRLNINTGRWAKVPVMIGTNMNEFRAFEAFIGLEKSSAILEFISSWFHTNDASHLAEHINALLQKPGKERYEAIDRFLTDLAFTCTSGPLASYLAAKGHDVWRYHFSGVYTNMALFGTHPDQGAYHTAEIAMVFGTSPANFTKPQEELSRKMQKIWAGMARDPGAGPGWPKIQEGKIAEMGDVNGSSIINIISPEKIDKDCKKLLLLAEAMGIAW